MGEQKRRKYAGFETTRTPPSMCLNCGYVMDSATAAGHNYKPYEGAIAICIKCNHIMSFNAQLRLCELNDEQISDLAGNKTFLRIMKAKGIADAEWKRNHR